MNPNESVHPMLGCLLKRPCPPPTLFLFNYLGDEQRQGL